VKNNKKSIHILMSQYSVDSRVRNETESLQSCYDIDVYCLKDQTNDFLDERNGIQLKRFGLKVHNKLIRFLSSYISMFFYSLGQQVASVHAHDLNALPLAFLIAKLKRVPLIYDSHELWSESAHGNYPDWVLNLAKRVEIFCAHRAEHIITVSPSIAKHLSELFVNNNISVIRNVPSYVHEGSFDLFREKFNISSSKPIFIYQGLISEARGVRMILEALCLVSKSLEYSFVFLGDGPFKDSLTVLIEEYQLSGNVFHENAVSQDVLLQYTSSADVGIHALDNSCLNHEYCLPNKIYEYLNAGIAVVCPDLTELSNFIEEEQVGSTYKCGNASALSIEIEKYIKNPELISKAKVSALESRKYLNWESEELKLFEIYKRVNSNEV
jgi:glycosyltransferase involved in cell wall biosynthesis